MAVFATADDLRPYLQDTASENDIVRGVQFSDSLLTKARDRALQEYNGLAGDPTERTTANFPPRYTEQLARGILSHALQMRAYNLLSNSMSMEGEGIAVDDRKPKAKGYLELSQQLRTEWMGWLQTVGTRGTEPTADSEYVVAGAVLSVGEIRRYLQDMASENAHLVGEEFSASSIDAARTRAVREYNAKAGDPSDRSVTDFPSRYLETLAQGVLGYVLSAKSRNLISNSSGEDSYQAKAQAFAQLAQQQLEQWRGWLASVTVGAVTGVTGSYAVAGASVSLADMRRHLQDLEAENSIMVGQEFPESSLDAGRSQALRDYNGRSGDPTTRTAGNFPSRYAGQMLEGAVGHALQMRGRNLLANSAGKDKTYQGRAQAYTQVGTQLIESWTQWLAAVTVGITTGVTADYAATTATLSIADLRRYLQDLSATNTILLGHEFADSALETAREQALQDYNSRSGDQTTRTASDFPSDYKGELANGAVSHVLAGRGRSLMANSAGKDKTYQARAQGYIQLSGEFQKEWNAWLSVVAAGAPTTGVDTVASPVVSLADMRRHLQDLADETGADIGQEFSATTLLAGREQAVREYNSRAGDPTSRTAESFPEEKAGELLESSVGYALRMRGRSLMARAPQKEGQAERAQAYLKIGQSLIDRWATWIRGVGTRGKTPSGATAASAYTIDGAVLSIADLRRYLQDLESEHATLVAQEFSTSSLDSARTRALREYNGTAGDPSVRTITDFPTRYVEQLTWGALGYALSMKGQNQLANAGGNEIRKTKAQGYLELSSQMQARWREWLAAITVGSATAGTDSVGGALLSVADLRRYLQDLDETNSILVGFEFSSSALETARERALQDYNSRSGDATTRTVSDFPPAYKGELAKGAAAYALDARSRNLLANSAGKDEAYRTRAQGYAKLASELQQQWDAWLRVVAAGTPSSGTDPVAAPVISLSDMRRHLQDLASENGVDIGQEFSATTLLAGREQAIRDYNSRSGDTESRTAETFPSDRAGELMRGAIGQALKMHGRGLMARAPQKEGQTERSQLYLKLGTELQEQWETWLSGIGTRGVGPTADSALEIAGAIVTIAEVRQYLQDLSSEHSVLIAEEFSASSIDGARTRAVNEYNGLSGDPATRTVTDFPTRYTEQLTRGVLSFVLEAKGQNLLSNSGSDQTTEGKAKAYLQLAQTHREQWARWLSAVTVGSATAGSDSVPGATLSLSDMRRYLQDLAAVNTTLVGYEFAGSSLEAARDHAIDQYNSRAGDSVTRSADNFLSQYKGELAKGAIGRALKARGRNLLANAANKDETYQARAQTYLQLGEELQEEWETWLRVVNVGTPSAGTDPVTSPVISLPDLRRYLQDLNSGEQLVEGHEFPSDTLLAGREQAIRDYNSRSGDTESRTAETFPSLRAGELLRGAAGHSLKMYGRSLLVGAPQKEGQAERAQAYIQLGSELQETWTNWLQSIGTRGSDPTASDSAYAVAGATVTLPQIRRYLQDLDSENARLIAEEFSASSLSDARTRAVNEYNGLSGDITSRTATTFPERYTEQLTRGIISFVLEAKSQNLLANSSGLETVQAKAQAYLQLAQQHREQWREWLAAVTIGFATAAADSVQGAVLSVGDVRSYLQDLESTNSILVGYDFNSSAIEAGREQALQDYNSRAGDTVTRSASDFPSLYKGELAKGTIGYTLRTRGRSLTANAAGKDEAYRARSQAYVQLGEQFLEQWSQWLRLVAVGTPSAGTDPVGSPVISLADMRRHLLDLDAGETLLEGYEFSSTALLAGREQAIRDYNSRAGDPDSRDAETFPATRSGELMRGAAGHALRMQGRSLLIASPQKEGQPERAQAYIQLGGQRVDEWEAWLQSVGTRGLGPTADDSAYSVAGAAVTIPEIRRYLQDLEGENSTLIAQEFSSSSLSDSRDRAVREYNALSEDPTSRTASSFPARYVEPLTRGILAFVLETKGQNLLANSAGLEALQAKAKGYLQLAQQHREQWKSWLRIVSIGTPTGGEDSVDSAVVSLSDMRQYLQDIDSDVSSFEGYEFSSSTLLAARDSAVGDYNSRSGDPTLRTAVTFPPSKSNELTRGAAGYALKMHGRSLLSTSASKEGQAERAQAYIQLGEQLQEEWKVWLSGIGTRGLEPTSDSGFEVAEAVVTIANVRHYLQDLSAEHSVLIAEEFSASSISAARTRSVNEYNGLAGDTETRTITDFPTRYTEQLTRGVLAFVLEAKGQNLLSNAGADKTTKEKAQAYLQLAQQHREQWREWLAAITIGAATAEVDSVSGAVLSAVDVRRYLQDLTSANSLLVGVEFRTSAIEAARQQAIDQYNSRAGDPTSRTATDFPESYVGDLTKGVIGHVLRARGRNLLANAAGKDEAYRSRAQVYIQLGEQFLEQWRQWLRLVSVGTPSAGDDTVVGAIVSLADLRRRLQDLDSENALLAGHEFSSTTLLAAREQALRHYNSRAGDPTSRTAVTFPDQNQGELLDGVAGYALNMRGRNLLIGAQQKEGQGERAQAYLQIGQRLVEQWEAWVSSVGTLGKTPTGATADADYYVDGASLPLYEIRRYLQDLEPEHSTLVAQEFRVSALSTARDRAIREYNALALDAKTRTVTNFPAAFVEHLAKGAMAFALTMKGRNLLANVGQNETKSAKGEAFLSIGNQLREEWKIWLRSVGTSGDVETEIPVGGRKVSDQQMYRVCYTDEAFPLVFSFYDENGDPKPATGATLALSMGDLTKSNTDFTCPYAGSNAKAQISVTTSDTSGAARYSGQLQAVFSGSDVVKSEPLTLLVRSGEEPVTLSDLRQFLQDVESQNAAVTGREFSSTLLALARDRAIREYNDRSGDPSTRTVENFPDQGTEALTKGAIAYALEMRAQNILANAAREDGSKAQSGRAQMYMSLREEPRAEWRQWLETIGSRGKDTGRSNVLYAGETLLLAFSFSDRNGAVKDASGATFALDLGGITKDTDDFTCPYDSDDHRSAVSIASSDTSAAGTYRGHLTTTFTADDVDVSDPIEIIVLSENATLSVDGIRRRLPDVTSEHSTLVGEEFSTPLLAEARERALKEYNGTAGGSGNRTIENWPDDDEEYFAWGAIAYALRMKSQNLFANAGANAAKQNKAEIFGQLAEMWMKEWRAWLNWEQSYQAIKNGGYHV